MPDPLNMTPVVAIVGCPNVGKSTLFNRLTRSRAAVVADEPGVTRDRQYGYAAWRDSTLLLIDTGGLAGGKTGDALAGLVAEQTLQAVAEADAVLWLVDGRAGLTAGDGDLAAMLRSLAKPVFVVVNKVDGLDASLAVAEFHAIGGFNAPLPVSAESGRGVKALLDAVRGALPKRPLPALEAPQAVKIAVVGRPNVGKSTLVNRMIGAERMLTSDAPGTTRDSIVVPFQRRQKDYALIDTAGIRRRARVTNKVEKFSVVKSLQAIEMCQIAVLVLDAQALVSAQDQTLLGIVGQAGKSLILAINKWDALSDKQKTNARRQLSEKTRFADYARVHYLSALHGAGVGKLFDSIDAIARSQRQSFKSALLSGLLHEAIQATPPPLVRGRRIKLKYAHLGGHDPVRVIIHGNQTQNVPGSYQRYLSNHFRKGMRLIGTPVLIEFKRGDNPYRGRKK